MRISPRVLLVPLAALALACDDDNPLEPQPRPFAAVRMFDAAAIDVDYVQVFFHSEAGEQTAPLRHDRYPQARDLIWRQPNDVLISESDWTTDI
jgi:hypothetical protein